jgi:hypothetical protein
MFGERYKAALREVKTQRNFEAQALLNRPVHRAGKIWTMRATVTLLLFLGGGLGLKQAVQAPVENAMPIKVHSTKVEVNQNRQMLTGDMIYVNPAKITSNLRLLAEIAPVIVMGEVESETVRDSYTLFRINVSQSLAGDSQKDEVTIGKTNAAASGPVQVGKSYLFFADPAKHPAEFVNDVPFLVGSPIDAIEVNPTTGEFLNQVGTSSNVRDVPKLIEEAATWD